MYKDDLIPDRTCGEDEAYEITIKKLENKAVTKLVLAKKTVTEIFFDKGYTPKWQVWDNETRKYKSKD